MTSVQFYRIITHHFPHFDEILAIYFLRKHGGKKFPGIHRARIEFVSDGLQPEGKSWQQHKEEGTFLVGIGGGPFDEHSTAEGEARKEGNSACSLVAKYLGIEKHPKWKRLVQLVTEADRAGVHELHVATRLKTKYRLNPEAPEKAIKWAVDIIEEWATEQQVFLNAQNMLRRNSYIVNSSVGGSPIKIAAVVGNNFKLGPAARSLLLDVLIQRKASGHVQIFSNFTSGRFNMKFVVANLRKAEMLANGMQKDEIAKVHPLMLESEGKIPEVPNWYFQVPGQNLLNGSETTPDTVATRIPLDKIIKIVRDYIFGEKEVFVET